MPSGNGLRQSGVVLSSIRNAALKGPLFHASIHDAALEGPLFHGGATEAFSRKQIRSRTFEGFGAQAQDVAVGIFDVELERPNARGGARATPAAQIDAGAVAVHGRELVRAPTCILKSQLFDVEGERGLRVFDAQDLRAEQKIGLRLSPLFPVNMGHPAEKSDLPTRFESELSVEVPGPAATHPQGCTYVWNVSVMAHSRRLRDFSRDDAAIPVVKPV